MGYSIGLPSVYLGEGHILHAAFGRAAVYLAFVYIVEQTVVVEVGRMLHIVEIPRVAVQVGVVHLRSAKLELAVVYEPRIGGAVLQVCAEDVGLSVHVAVGKGYGVDVCVRQTERGIVRILAVLVGVQLAVAAHSFYRSALVEVEALAEGFAERFVYLLALQRVYAYACHCRASAGSRGRDGLSAGSGKGDGGVAVGKCRHRAVGHGAECSFAAVYGSHSERLGSGHGRLVHGEQGVGGLVDKR